MAYRDDGQTFYRRYYHLKTVLMGGTDDERPMVVIVIHRIAFALQTLLPFSSKRLSYAALRADRAGYANSLLPYLVACAG